MPEKKMNLFTVNPACYNYVKPDAELAGRISYNVLVFFRPALLHNQLCTCQPLNE